jgi:hypothetical protein
LTQDFDDIRARSSGEARKFSEGIFFGGGRGEPYQNGALFTLL